MPGAALEDVMQRLRAVVDLYCALAGFVGHCLPPVLKFLLYGKAIVTDLLDRPHVLGGRGVINGGQILDAVLHCLQKRVGYLIDVVREVADAAITPRGRALAEARRRKLQDVALPGSADGQTLCD